MLRATTLDASRLARAFLNIDLSRPLLLGAPTSRSFPLGVSTVRGVPVTWVAIDLETRTVSFRFSDGRRVDVPMPSDMLAEPSNLQRIELNVDAAQLSVTMPGEQALVELRHPGQDVEALRAGRPMIYLDQNHWSQIAAARHGHRPVREDERQAALRVADLAEAGTILLPVSAGHLVETTPLHGARRVALAGTVLALGRGWQMRNPLSVRAEELLRAVRGADSAASDVFVPAMDGFLGSSQCSTTAVEMSGEVLATCASAEQMTATALEQLASPVPAVLGLYDAIIDEEAIPDDDGVARVAAEGWARGLEELAAMLRGADEPADVVRRAAGARMLVDMIDDIVRVAGLVGITPEAVIDRLTTTGDPVARMPFLAQMRQMLFARLRNAGQSWEANDLVDIMFLCCAAGYADLVVGERGAVGYLRQARQPMPRAWLATSLQEAVGAIKALGALDGR